MEGVLVLLGLALLLVPVLLVVALAMIAGLRGRVADLEQAVEGLRRGAAQASAAASSAPAQAAAGPAHSGAAGTGYPDDGRAGRYGADDPASDGVPPIVETPPPAPYRPDPLDPLAASVRPAPPPLPPVPPREAWHDADAAPAPVPPARPRAPDAPDPLAIALRAVKRWFTSGNVPVKVGMLVLFAGVAALLKYASDQGWLTLPIGLRLAGIAAAAVAGLVFGWRKRDSHRAFALSLQGGMIGILLLVVFAAFRLYGMLPAAAAFAASVALVAGAGVLAVLQNAKALAVFAVLAGFLAPIWLSTGSGNHVALFGYYAMLNAAILGIAWFRSWRVLNLLGFAFTFGIGILWGVLDYDPAKYASTQPFLLLFFLFYLAIPLLYARRMPAGRRDLIDGCLVFGTPLVAFSLQAALLRSDTLALAFCALGVAALYAALAWTLLRRENFNALAQSYALLAVGFATLAVPLALSAQATACVFALEGAALVWLGLRQQRWLPRFTGGALQVAAAVTFALAAGGHVVPASAMPFLHGLFAGALIIALAGFAIAWCCRGAGRMHVALFAYLWAVAWWVGAFSAEIVRVVPWRSVPDALLALAAVSGWIAAELHRRHPARALGATLLAALLVAAPLALWQVALNGQPFAGTGLWAWLVFAVLGVRGLVCLRTGDDAGIARAAQFVWWLLWPLVASLLLRHVALQTGRALPDGLGDGWAAVALALPWLLLAAVSLRRWSWLAAPLGTRFDPMRAPLQAVVFLGLLAGWLVALRMPGASTPLPWIAVLNPLDLLQGAVLLLVAQWSWSAAMPDAVRRARVPVLAALAFLLVTAITLRGAHHWGGVDWSLRLSSSSLAQTSLTVVWSILGVFGWVVGSRRGQRLLWLAGAALMAIVLAKLVLVDRGHLGNLWGIGSFIAYGLLCTVVGFFAPAPPRAAGGDEIDGTSEEAKA
ncbi:DUF2339 domain-containing protein [Luteimonas sp. BDR2-5]|uniref:DUF2339 domain-containing protein n=1 Tax=Proluteimonas luteida TaxID=2878685 RepID=UPI001E351F8C|nr:DUF2339 domain-containing protein [Luteimonas sp. BDR2-5]MCD9028856.1 DUF2339 domain-containing protein [Luteimonas sp. BDR2-5]